MKFSVICREIRTIRTKISKCCLFYKNMAIIDHIWCFQYLFTVFSWKDLKLCWLFINQLFVFYFTLLWNSKIWEGMWEWLDSLIPSNFFLFPWTALKAGFTLIPSGVQLFFNPMDCSPPGASVHGISQARILEWVAISSSRGSSRPRDQIQASSTGRWILYHWATKEARDLLLKLYFQMK